MHYHCEVIIPPTELDKIQPAISALLAPFDETSDDESVLHPFWDFWVIGGRWAGTKIPAGCDKEKLDEFYDWMKREGVTVSGLQCGKQELSPATQITKVDAKWNEMFPGADGQPKLCPIFRHSNDQFGDGLEGTMPGDICELRDALEIECQRIVFAGPSFVSDANAWTGPLEATFMLCTVEWNGTNYMKVDWDGKVGSAVEQLRKHARHYGEEYKARIVPQNDWLSITVDYHS